MYIIISIEQPDYLTYINVDNNTINSNTNYKRNIIYSNGQSRFNPLMHRLQSHSKLMEAVKR